MNIHVIQPHNGTEVTSATFTMADLYNLLDGLDEAQEEELVEQQQEWEETEDQDLPPALAEAAKRKLPTEEEEDFQVGADLDKLSTPTESVAELPYTKLQSLWAQEIRSPELLPFDQETIDEISRGIEEAEDRIDSLAAEGMTGNANMDSLFSSVLNVDLERVKYLFTDLLKLRLEKIEAHPLHMRENLDRMSDREVEYLKAYGAMVENHLRRTVLDHFPQDAWKKLDEPDMIDQPDLETYVFIRTKEDVEIEDVEPFFAEAGSSLIVQYNRVRDLYLKGKVELLV